MSKYAIYAQDRVVATAHSKQAAEIKTADSRRRGHKAVKCYERATGLLTAY